MHITLPHGRRKRRALPFIVLLSLFLSLVLPLTTPASLAGETPSTDDFEDVGVIGEGEYESPQHGYSVEWSDAWDIDFDYDPPVVSDEETGRDDIKLAWFGDDGEQGFANFIGAPTGELTAEQDLEPLLDPDMAAEIWGDDLEQVVLMEDIGRDGGAVLLALVESDDDDKPSESLLDVYVSLFIVAEIDDASLLMTISGDVSHFAAAYDMADEILVDGDELLTPFRAGEIDDALVVAMELATPAQAGESELEELGLVGEGEYESLQFGYTVEWSSDWVLDDFYAVPLVSDTEAGIDQLYLAWRGEEADSADSTYVMVGGQDDGNVDDTLELWTSDEFAEEAWGGEAEPEVILEDANGDTGVVLYSLVAVDGGEQHYKVMIVVERDGGEVLHLTLNTWEPEFEAAWEAAEEIVVDGDPLPAAISWDEIEEVIEDAA